MNRVVARSASAVVVLRHVSAYPDGCLLDYAAAAQLPDSAPVREELRALFVTADGHPPLHVELRLADGRSSSILETVDLRVRATGPGEEINDPAPPVMMGLPGDGAVARGNVIEQHQPVWLWPLPPPEELHIAVRWTRFGIDEVTHALDGAAIAAAARSARSYWDGAADSP